MKPHHRLILSIIKNSFHNCEICNFSKPPLLFQESGVLESLPIGLKLYWFLELEVFWKNKKARKYELFKTCNLTAQIWLGWKDLNPRNDGVRVHCLTAWLHPSLLFSCLLLFTSADLYSIPLYRKNVNHFSLKIIKKSYLSSHEIK